MIILNMNIAFQLYQLQEIDTQVDKIHKRLAEIDAFISNSDAKIAAEQAIETAKTKFIQETVVFDRLNDQIEKKKIKISQSESTLYSGTVQNPKELEDLQQEIASLKKAITNLEDEQLQALEKLELAETNLNLAKRNAKTLDSELATKFSMLIAEKENLLTSDRGLQKKRTSTISQIDPALISQYNTLRKSKRGKAVTKVLDGACGACGASLTASQQQSARSSREMFICPTCKRIIYGSS